MNTANESYSINSCKDEEILGIALHAVGKEMLSYSARSPHPAPLSQVFQLIQPGAGGSSYIEVYL